MVGAVAPLTQGKGQDLFLQCIRQLRDAGKQAQFVIAGDGPEEEALRRQCRELGLSPVVTFVTRLKQFRSVMDTLDIFVRPSLSDGSAFALMKAMGMAKAEYQETTYAVNVTLKTGQVERVPVTAFGIGWRRRHTRAAPGPTAKTPIPPRATWSISIRR